MSILSLFIGAKLCKKQEKTQGFHRLEKGNRPQTFYPQRAIREDRTDISWVEGKRRGKAYREIENFNISFSLKWSGCRSYKLCLTERVHLKAK